jgi:RNA polymerase sigma-70 factor, ECF subfamily
MGPTDEQLVEAVLAGDTPAFDVLVQRWERKIRGAAYRIVGSDEEARDVCQEAFLKAYRGLAAFKGGCKFSSWLYQIAINLCRDRLRRRKVRNLVSIEDLESAVEPSWAVQRAVAHELVEARELSRAVSAAVASLPEEQREVIVLKEYQGLTFPEIAEALDVPLSTVKTRLYRGLVHLRGRLEKQGIRGATPAAAPASRLRQEMRS